MTRPDALRGPDAAEAERERLERRREYLATLSREQQHAYAESEALRQALNDDNPRMVAIHLANCLRDRVWETGIAYLPGHATMQKMRTFDGALEWMEQELKTNPDTIMRRLTGAHPRIDDATAAAKALLAEVAKEDLDAFKSFMGDCRDGDDNLPGWRTLLNAQANMLNGLWTETAALAETLTIDPRGAPVGNQNAAKENNSAHCAELFPARPADGRGKDGKPTDRRGRAIRTFLNLQKNPEACVAKGTTPERVEAAYSRLIRGLTTVEGAKREAGIAAPKPNGGLGIKGPAAEVAVRVVRELGPERAAELAKAILSLVDT
jgi:hypothetical protein